MDFPSELRYTEDHEWIRIDGSSASIGITDFAQGELGEIVYVEVDTVGETLAKGEVFGTVEAVKTTSELYMPVSGKITAFNSEIDESEEDNPGIINEDPYGKGWIITIEMADPSEISDLLSADVYKEIVE
ncbi:MAG: glycine cleavage system protein GcvH [Saprospiraceae bacterium]|jgi:glycine cleavage system H protein